MIGDEMFPEVLNVGLVGEFGKQKEILIGALEEIFQEPAVAVPM